MNSPPTSGTSTPQPTSNRLSVHELVSTPSSSPSASTSTSTSLSARRHQRQRSSVSVSVKKKPSKSIFNPLNETDLNHIQPQPAEDTVAISTPSTSISTTSTSIHDPKNPPDNSLSSISIPITNLDQIHTSTYPEPNGFHSSSSFPSPTPSQSLPPISPTNSNRKEELLNPSSPSNRSNNIPQRSPSPNLSLRTTHLDKPPTQDSLIEEEEDLNGDDVPLGSPIATSELEWNPNQSPIRDRFVEEGQLDSVDSLATSLEPARDQSLVDGIDSCQKSANLGEGKEVNRIQTEVKPADSKPPETLSDQLQVDEVDQLTDAREHTTPIAKQMELPFAQKLEEDDDESTTPPPLPAKDPPSIHSSRNSSPILSQNPSSLSAGTRSSNTLSDSPESSSHQNSKLNSTTSTSPSSTSTLFKSSNLKNLSDSSSTPSRPGAIRRASLLSSSVNITLSDGRSSPSLSERGIRPESPTTTPGSIGRRGGGGILPLRSSGSASTFSSNSDRSGSTSPITPRRIPISNQQGSNKSKRMSLGYISSPTITTPTHTGNGNGYGSKPGTPLSELSREREYPFSAGSTSASSANGTFATQQSQMMNGMGYGSARNSVASTNSDGIGLLSEEGESSLGHGSSIAEEFPNSGSFGISRRREDGETVMSTHKDLLGVIAKKERRCLELREELQREESELKALQTRWQASVSRDLAEDQGQPVRPSLSSNDSSSSNSQFKEGVDSLPSLSNLSLEGVSIVPPLDGNHSSNQPQMMLPKSAQEAWKGLSSKLPAGLGSQLNAFLDGLAPEVTPPTRKAREPEPERTPLGLEVLKEDEEMEEERESSGTTDQSTRPTSVDTFTSEVGGKPIEPQQSQRTSKAAKRTSIFGGISALQKQLEETLVGASSNSGNSSQGDSESNAAGQTTNKGWGNFSKRWKEARDVGNGLLSKAEKSIDDFIASAPIDESDEAKVNASAKGRRRSSLILPFSPKSPEIKEGQNQWGNPQFSGGGRDHRNSVLWNKLLDGPPLSPEEPTSPIPKSPTSFIDQNEKEKTALREFGNGWFSYGGVKNDEGKSNRLSPQTLLSLSDGIAPVRNPSQSSTSGRSLSPNKLDWNRRLSSGSGSTDDATSSKSKSTHQKKDSLNSISSGTTTGGGIFDMLASALSGGELPPRTSQESRRSMEGGHRESGSIGGRSTTRLAAQSAVSAANKETEIRGTERKIIDSKPNKEDYWTLSLQAPILPTTSPTTSPSEKIQTSNVGGKSLLEEDSEADGEAWGW